MAMKGMHKVGGGGARILCKLVELQTKLLADYTRLLMKIP